MAYNIGKRTMALSQTIDCTGETTASGIQALIDAVPKYIAKGATITFDFYDSASVTYTCDAPLEWSEFYGGGKINIFGNTTEAYGSTSKSVNFVFDSGIDGIILKNNTANICFNYCLTHTTNKKSLAVDNCTSIYSDGSVFKCENTTAGSVGLSITDSFVVVDDTCFLNGYYGVEADRSFVDIIDVTYSTSYYPQYSIRATEETIVCLGDSFPSTSGTSLLGGTILEE
jgi:hypothetical protein